MKVIFSMFFLFIGVIAFSQSDYKKMFSDADYYFSSEQYQKASELYIEVYKSDTTHYNSAYKAGVCYVEMPNMIWKAIPFLLSATRNTTDKYKDGTYKIKQAPVEAYYYLAYAYHLTMQLDEAIKYYTLYEEAASTNSFKLSDYELRIKCCNTAKKFKNNPRSIEIENVGHNINTGHSEFNPCVSSNDSVMYFTREIIQISDDDYSDKVYRIMRSFKSIENGEAVWDEAEDITMELDATGNVYTLSTSNSGKTLLLFKDKDPYDKQLANDDGTILISYFRNAKWSAFEELPQSALSSAVQTHASISDDGKTIYYTDVNPDGNSGLDIYCIHKNSDETWSLPENLGSTVNSTQNETTPYIINDTILFFSSKGHENIGGFDIFRSIKSANGKWSEPENLSIPINSAADDYGFVPVDNGKQAYFSAERPDGYLTFGKKDIFHIVLEPKEISEVVDSLLDTLSVVDNSILTDAIVVETADNREQKNEVAYVEEPIVQTPKVEKETEQQSENSAPQSEIKSSATTYEIQILSSNIPFNMQTKFAGMQVQEHYGNAGYYRYTTGVYNNYSEAKNDLARIKGLGYADAYVQRTLYYIENEMQFDRSKAFTIQLLSTNKRTNCIRKFAPLQNIVEFYSSDGVYTYCTGSFDSKTDAENELNSIKENGFDGVVIEMNTLPTILSGDI